MMKLIRRLIRLRRNESGSPSVEFVFAAPVLILMAMGIIEFGMIMLITVLVEGGLRDAARYGITGQEPERDQRLAKIISIIEDRTVGLMDMDEATIEVVAYPAFEDVDRGEEYVDGNSNGKYDPGETFIDENDNNRWDKDIGDDGAGESGEVVVYRLEYDWPLRTLFLGELIGEDGHFPIKASIAVRNEPWETGA